MEKPAAEKKNEWTKVEREVNFIASGVKVKLDLSKGVTTEFKPVVVDVFKNAACDVKAEVRPGDLFKLKARHTCLRLPGLTAEYEVDQNKDYGIKAGYRNKDLSVLASYKSTGEKAFSVDYKFRRFGTYGIYRSEGAYGVRAACNFKGVSTRVSLNNKKEGSLGVVVKGVKVDLGYKDNTVSVGAATERFDAKVSLDKDAPMEKARAEIGCRFKNVNNRIVLGLGKKKTRTCKHSCSYKGFSVESTLVYESKERQDAAIKVSKKYKNIKGSIIGKLSHDKADEEGKKVKFGYGCVLDLMF